MFAKNFKNPRPIDEYILHSAATLRHGHQQSVMLLCRLLCKSKYLTKALCMQQSSFYKTLYCFYKIYISPSHRIACDLVGAFVSLGNHRCCGWYPWVLLTYCWASESSFPMSEKGAWKYFLMRFLAGITDNILMAMWSVSHQDLRVFKL